MSAKPVVSKQPSPQPTPPQQSPKNTNYDFENQLDRLNSRIKIFKSVFYSRVPKYEQVFIQRKVGEKKDKRDAREHQHFKLIEKQEKDKINSELMRLTLKDKDKRMEMLMNQVNKCSPRLKNNSILKSLSRKKMQSANLVAPPPQQTNYQQPPSNKKSPIINNIQLIPIHSRCSQERDSSNLQSRELSISAQESLSPKQQFSPVKSKFQAQASLIKELKKKAQGYKFIKNNSKNQSPRPKVKVPLTPSKTQRMYQVMLPNAEKLVYSPRNQVLSPPPQRTQKLNPKQSGSINTKTPTCNISTSQTTHHKAKAESELKDHLNINFVPIHKTKNSVQMGYDSTQVKKRPYINFGISPKAVGRVSNAQRQLSKLVQLATEPLSPGNTNRRLPSPAFSGFSSIKQSEKELRLY